MSSDSSRAALESSESPKQSGITIARRTAADVPALDAIYADVFGDQALESSRERWRWQYERNPHCPEEGPEIWVAREAGEILGQYASMPVRLWVRGEILKASWGMDVMVRPNQQRRGIGSRLFLYWDKQVGASLGLGLSQASYTLFKKLQWQDVGPVPCYSKILSPGALIARGRPGVREAAAAIIAPLLRAALWVAFPQRASRRDDVMSALRCEPLAGPFDERFDHLWERVKADFDFIAERRADYLEWKYRQIPYVSYEVLQVSDEEQLRGYAVMRIAERNGVKLALLCDWLAAPDDAAAAGALLDAVIDWARGHKAARLQSFTFDARLSSHLQYKGFMQISSPMQFCLRVHSEHVDQSFFQDTSRWHVTFGDSDQDRDV